MEKKQYIREAYIGTCQTSMRKFSPENRCCAGFEAVAVPHNTAQKMKFSIKGFFSKCDQIRWKLRIWSHLLKKSLMENFILYAV